jgi:Flp pilus assembly protein TadD
VVQESSEGRDHLSVDLGAKAKLLFAGPVRFAQACMKPLPSRHATLSILFLPILVATAQVPALAQRAQPPGTGSQGGGFQTDLLVTVVVSVRESGGMPLQASAFVKLSSDFSGTHLTAPTRDGGAATFPSIHAGDYEVEVSSSGYKTITEHASVMAGGSSYNVYVYVSPESAPDSGRVAPAKTTMTPHLQSEIDKGLDKMRRQQFEAARSHFDKAAKMAPGNPDVQYLLGMLEYYQQHYDLARTRLETAVAIYPSHERALLTLGEIQLRSGQTSLAVQTLEKAYVVNGADWHTHYLLAFAYAEQKEFEKARAHAQRAADLGGKDHGVPARVLLGRILVTENKISEAKQVFAGVVRDFPNAAASTDAQAALAALEKPAVIGTTETPATNAPPSASQPAAAPPAVIRPWAPPDVDAKEYVVAPDVTCSTEQLLHRTQARTMKQIANLEKFLATEHIEHQDVDSYGNQGPVKAKDFTYLVFIRKTNKDSFFLEEERDGGENLSQFPTALASRGLVGLGVFLFAPEYQSDVTYKCLGLGEWRGQAAWEIRFEQRKEIASRLMTWRNNRGIFPVALKGRVWVAANSYDLLHIETDLREPIPQLELERDRLSIDYGPVKFDHGTTSLWLPWYAELYMQVHGKRYHHRHTLTNYALFSVDTDHQIDSPKKTTKQN